jgi:hypothetical protein
MGETLFRYRVSGGRHYISQGETLFRGETLYRDTGMMVTRVSAITRPRAQRPLTTEDDQQRISFIVVTTVYIDGNNKL